LFLSWPTISQAKQGLFSMGFSPCLLIELFHGNS
jgi:hypothetical protein